MIINWSAKMRGKMGDGWSLAIGKSAIIQLWSGPMPVDCATTPTGTQIASVQLDFIWYSEGTNDPNGTVYVQKGGANLSATNAYSQTAAAAGTITFYRFCNSSGECYEQGDVSLSGGGGALELTNVDVAVGETIDIVGFSKTPPTS